MEWMDECTDGWMGGCRWINGYIIGMGGWMDG